MPNNLKVALVTGATGFIGSHLARRLINEGWKVNVFVRESSDFWRIRDISRKLKIHIVDLRSREQVSNALNSINPEYIFHLAIGGVYGGTTLTDYELFESNLVGTVNLIESAKQISYKALIVTGSSGEYGMKSDVMKESDVCEPANVYGITKYASTLYSILAAKNNSKPIVVLRPFSPFGPGEVTTRLVGYAITNALKSADLALANPDSVRDFIYVEDLIDAYLQCAPLADKYKGEIFNIGSGKETSIRRIVEKILELTGSKSKIKWNSQTSRPGESSRWQADVSKAKELLKWEPKHTLEEGIRKTIQWYKTNG
jgi:nucleoside-diphosphate-sugar epimerase